MTALPILLTNAGWQAFAAAQLEPDIDLNVSSVGLTAAAFDVAPTLTALPGEFKRIEELSGQVVGADVIHLTASDASPQSFEVRGFGLFLEDGTLFAVYGQSTPILQKSAAASMLFALDIKLLPAVVAEIVFGNSSFLYPPATETVKGVAEIATQAEVDDAEDAERFITPKTLGVRLAALWAAIAAFVGTALANYVPATRQILATGLAGGGGALDQDRTIDVPAATAAEVKAGTEAGKAITPAALRAAQSYSAGATGVRITEDGHVEQWGVYEATHTSEDVVQITFPIAFPVACDNLQLTGLVDQATDQRDIWPQPIKPTVTPQGFTVQLQTSGLNIRIDGFFWRALGR